MTARGTDYLDQLVAPGDIIVALELCHPEHIKVFYHRYYKSMCVLCDYCGRLCGNFAIAEQSREIEPKSFEEIEQEIQ